MIAKRGSAYGRFLRNFPQAISDLNDAIKYGYGEDWVYENLAISYAMSGDIDNSLKTFQQALKKNPNSSKLHKNIAATYSQMGDMAKAAEYQKKGEELAAQGL